MKKINHVLITILLVVALISCTSKDKRSSSKEEDATDKKELILPTYKSNKGLPGFPDRFAFGGGWVTPSWNAKGKIPFDMWEDYNINKETTENVVTVIAFEQLLKKAGPVENMDSEFDEILYALSNSKGLLEYLKEYKLKLKEVNNKNKPVVFIIDPDQIDLICHKVIEEYKGDASNLSVALDKTGHEDVLKSNVPNNFSGFCQLLSYMRDKYAPNVMIAATLKTQNRKIQKGRFSSVNLTEDKLNIMIKNYSEFWKSCGIVWQVLILDWCNSKELRIALRNGTFENILKLYGGVAKNLGIRVVNWGIEAPINLVERELHIKEWPVNITFLIFKYSDLMWENGFQGAIFTFDKNRDEPKGLGDIGRKLKRYYREL